MNRYEVIYERISRKMVALNKDKNLSRDINAIISILIYNFYLILNNLFNYKI